MAALCRDARAATLAFYKTQLGALAQEEPRVLDIVAHVFGTKKCSEDLPCPVDPPPPLWDISVDDVDGQRQTLQRVCPRAWTFVRRRCQPQCMICLDEAPTGGWAVFTGATVAGHRHDGRCPMTQPGHLCVTCAARTIAGGWDAARTAVTAHPSCPFCHVAISEATVVLIDGPA